MLNKFLNKLSDNEKKVFYVMMAIVMLALVDRLLLGPFIEKIQIISEEIARKTISIKRDLRIVEYKERILDERKTFSRYFTEEVPDEDVISANFLSTVEQLATQAKVNLVKSNPSGIVKQRKFIEFYAELDCSGELSDVISFVHAINSTDELLKVVSFNLAAKRGAESQVNSSMKIVKLIINDKMINEPSAP